MSYLRQNFSWFVLLLLYHSRKCAKSSATNSIEVGWTWEYVLTWLTVGGWWTNNKPPIFDIVCDNVNSTAQSRQFFSATIPSITVCKPVCCCSFFVHNIHIHIRLCQYRPTPPQPSKHQPTSVCLSTQHTLPIYPRRSCVCLLHWRRVVVNIFIIPQNLLLNSRDAPPIPSNLAPPHSPIVALTFFHWGAPQSKKNCGGCNHASATQCVLRGIVNDGGEKIDTNS